MDTALTLAGSATSQGGFYLQDEAQAARLQVAADTVKHRQLPAVLRCGVGFHYAAMEQEDRLLVEQLFLDRLLPVCSANMLETHHSFYASGRSARNQN